MQKRSLKSVIALFSLLMFLLTASGNVFGYTWCLGEEHSRVEQVIALGCADEEVVSTDVDIASFAGLAKKRHNHNRPCLDVLLAKDHAVVSKRGAKLAKVDFETRASLGTSVPYVRSALKRRPYVAPARESQTILAHRSVVLRN